MSISLRQFATIRQNIGVSCNLCKNAINALPKENMTPDHLMILLKALEIMAQLHVAEIELYKLDVSVIQTPN